MALSKKQISDIRDELSSSQNPLFLFHDDADGLCSFLLLYRLHGDGKGIVIKTTPRVTTQFLPKVAEYAPDKIFILDLAMLDQEFVDAVKRPVIWIDHHDPQDLDNVKSYNPRRTGNDCHPVSYLCYLVAKQDQWISMCGSIGDWFLPPEFEEFRKEYPDLFEAEIKQPDDVLFETRFGELIRILSFILKGKTGDVMKCVRILTRIESPYELLNRETAQARYIYKRYAKINDEYVHLRKDALAAATDDPFLVFIYPDHKISLTKDLANEVLHHHRDKIIIIGREKDDEVKLSLRAQNHVIPPILQHALKGLNGYGGGHEHACGACVKKAEFKMFLENFRGGIGN
ncbi:MAG: DHH family phosphoesterase [archaeon]